MSTPLPQPYGPLFLRGAAFAADALIVLAAYGFASHSAWALERAELGYWALAAIAGLYFVILPATPLQGTPGKRMGRMRIADTAGRRIGLGRAFIRFAASVPSIALAGIGFLVAAWTPRRQALHDLAAGTLVVKLDATPEQVGRPAPTLGWFARLGLALTLALLIALGHSFVLIQQDRATRNRIVSALYKTTAYRAEVHQALAARLPPPPAPQPPKDVRAISVRPDGTIVVELAAELAPGGRVFFHPTPVAQRNGEHWRCSAEAIHPKLLPAGCRP